MFNNQYPYTDFHELNLDWFLAEFKKVTDKVTTLDATVQEFTTFVTNYFENLDVQQEINNKLNAMAADGSLSALIQPMFDEYKTEINGIVATQNTTIGNQNDKIAVLEGRMDTFSQLTDGSTSGDAELQDIRVAFDGTTYATAGDAVRGQADFLNDEIDILSKDGIMKNMTYRSDYVQGGINADGTLNPSQTSRFSSSDWIDFEHMTFMYVASGYQVILYSKAPDGTIGASSWKVGPATFLLNDYYEYKLSVWKSGSWSASKPDKEKINVLLSNDDYYYSILNKINYQKISSGVITPDMSFCVGNLNNATGVPTPTDATYRAITPSIQTAPYDMEISVNTGYRFSVYKYAADDTFTGETGWRTTATIDAGQKFRIYLAQNPDHSGNLSIDDLITFMSNFNMKIVDKSSGSTGKVYAFLEGGNKPKLAAHMGYRPAGVPANTLPAFIAAGKNGFWGIESDVRETADGYFVMMHDNDVSITTDGTGNVSDLTYSYIRSLHMRSNPAVGVPSLEEYLGACKQYGCVAIPEIKSMTHFSEFVDIIKSFGLQNSCIVIGSKWTLSTFRGVESDIPYMAIYQNSGGSVDIDSEISFLTAYENTGMDLDSTYGITLANAKKVHAAGLIFGTFTVDSIDTTKHDFQNGIDFVTTNTVKPTD